MSFDRRDFMTEVCGQLFLTIIAWLIITFITALVWPNGSSGPQPNMADWGNLVRPGIYSLMMGVALCTRGKKVSSVYGSVAAFVVNSVVLVLTGTFSELPISKVAVYWACGSLFVILIAFCMLEVRLRVLEKRKGST